MTSQPRPFALKRKFSPTVSPLSGAPHKPVADEGAAPKRHGMVRAALNFASRLRVSSHTTSHVAVSQAVGGQG